MPNSIQYQDVDYEYFQKQAENILIRDQKLVVDRFIIPVEESVYLYTLPDYVIDIRRITYLGRKLDPYNGPEQIYSGSTAIRYGNGEPRAYIYSYIGKKTIRFFPTPAITISSTGDPWSGPVIREQCVVEFFRTPDFNDPFKRLPDWMMQQFTENYAILQMSQQDNQAYDSKTIANFNTRWENDILNIKKFKDRLFQMTIKQLGNQFELFKGQPGRPQLPWNFGARRY